MRLSVTGTYLSTVRDLIGALEKLMEPMENIDFVVEFLGSTDGTKYFAGIAPDLLAKARDYRDREAREAKEDARADKVRRKQRTEDERLLKLQPLEVVSLVSASERGTARETMDCAAVLASLGLDPAAFETTPPASVGADLCVALHTSFYRRMPGSTKPKEPCLLRFPPGRSITWLQDYCRRHPEWEMGEIWDLPDIGQLGTRTVIIPGSSWFPGFSTGGDSSSYPVILPNTNGNGLMIAEISPYIFSSPSELYWLMRRPAASS